MTENIHNEIQDLKTSRKATISEKFKGAGIFDIDRWQEIWQAITHNKSRSVLTAFGVFWGMFMLVVMVGAGDSLQKGMQEQIEGFATNSCFVSNSITSEPYKGSFLEHHQLRHSNFGTKSYRHPASFACVVWWAFDRKKRNPRGKIGFV